MAAPIWSTAADSFVRGEEEVAAATVISQELVSAGVKLADFVEGLGKYLTSTDVSARGKATKLLADILHRLNSNSHFLNEKEVDLLTSFFCSKLSDHHSIQPPALHGLVALSCHPQLPEGVSQAICRQIFKEIQNQTLAQGDRRAVYVIFSNLLYRKLSELQQMESDFVCGFIQAMDAERDPRNLVICFQLVQTITQNFPLGVFVEEMFEVTSCYFPISFKPSADDPGSVTQDDLVSGLRGCMTASPKFGQYCLPLLLEKINSDVQSAKIDSFETLAVCCGVYEASCVSEFTSSLLSCIKREVFSSASDQLTSSALSALEAIGKTLSQGITQRNKTGTFLSEFLKEVIQEFSRYLKEPDLRLISPTCKLLQSVSGSSDPACWSMLNSVLPVLIEQFATHTQSNERKTILDNMKGFLMTSGKFTYSNQAPSPVLEYKSTLMELSSAALEDPSSGLRLSGTQMMHSMLSLPGVLSEQEIETSTKEALKHLLKDMDRSVRNECLAVLKQMTKLKPSLMKSEIIRQIISQLHNDPMETGESPFTADKEYILRTLSSLVMCEDVLQMVFTELLTFLQSETDNLALVAAECLSQVANENRSNEKVVDFLYGKVLPQILCVLLDSGNERGDGSGFSDSVLTQLAKVFRTVTVSLDRRKAESLLHIIHGLFMKGEVSVLPELKLTTEKVFHPLKASSPKCHTRLVVIVQAVLCSLPKQTAISDVIPSLESLLHLFLGSHDQLTQQSSIKCCAGLVNKIPVDQVDTFLKKYEETFQMSNDHDQRKCFLDAHIWLTKALILQGHPKGTEYVQKLITYLEDPNLGLAAANGFLTLVTEFDDVMTKEMAANIHIFYRQKLFTQHVGVLTKKFQAASEANKSSHLLAILHLLRFLPKQVLQGELKSLMPILLQSLLSDQSDLLISTLTKLTELTSDAADIISKNLDNLVPHLLKLSSGASTMKVRIATLRCLNALTELPCHVTLPHKVKVTRSLQQVLDDKKRLVRKEAVAASGNWYLIGEPGK